MFGDLFGNFEEKQKELKKLLADIKIDEYAGDDNAIHVTANANREIVNISIDKEKIDLSDSEQLEDLLLITINRALEKAADAEASETQRLMQDMLPPGLGNLTNLFGRG